MTLSRSPLVPLILTAGCLCNANGAFAQAINDRFWLEASAFRPKIQSSAQATRNVDSAQGTKIDLEDDLGFDSRETLPAFLAGARVSKRFSVIGEYFSINRDTSATLARDITYNGVTFPVAGTVTSSFDSDIYRLVMGYSVVRSSKAEVGVALGLHATKFKFTIEGEGSTPGTPVQLERRTNDFLAPLPTLGLYASYEIMPRLTASARVDYLSLKVGDYDGRLLNTQAKLSYRIMKNVGIGAAWRRVDYRVDVEKERYTGHFKYKFSGPALFLEAGF